MVLNISIHFASVYLREREKKVKVQSLKRKTKKKKCLYCAAIPTFFPPPKTPNSENVENESFNDGEEDENWMIERLEKNRVCRWSALSTKYLIEGVGKKKSDELLSKRG